MHVEPTFAAVVVQLLVVPLLAALALLTGCAKSVTGYETLQTFSVSLSLGHRKHGSIIPSCENGSLTRRLIPTAHIGAHPRYSPRRTSHAPCRRSDPSLLRSDAQADEQY